MKRRRPKAPVAKTAAKPGALRAAAWIAAVTLMIAAYIALANWLRFTQDDAFISLRYARNLVEGLGLVFNEGERVEGYSNFLWTLLLALTLKLGLPPVAASQWLGMAFGAAVVFTVARFARALEGRWGPASLAAAAFVALNPAFALWSTGGLETAMFAFLVALGVERSFAPGVGERGRAIAPLIFVLATLTRPEGPLVFAACFAVRAFDTWRGGPSAHPQGRRGIARDLLLFVVPLAPYAAWKLWYFGDLLPNPFHAKTGWSVEHLRRGFDYTADLARGYALWGAAPIVAIFALFHAGRRGVELRLLAILLVWATYVVLIGGDVLYLHRFWLHVLPLGAVVLARGVDGLAAAAFAKLAPARAAARPAVALLAAALLAGFGAQRNLAATQERRTSETAFVTNMTRNGLWLRDNLPRESTIAITTIGAISYYSRLRVIDMLGLTDREVARNPKLVEGLTDNWREIQYNAESVLRRRPDAIFFSTSIRPSSAAEKALFFYEWFHRAYYPYYYRSTPWRSNIQNYFRLRPDAPPFDPALVQASGVEWVDHYSFGHLAKSRDQDNAKAIELFGESARLAPPAFLWAREWWGVSLYDEGDTAAALPILQDVCERDPFATVARSRLAEWALKQGDVEEAKRRFEEMRAVDPDDSMPWVGLAEIARKQGDLDAAYANIREGVRLWDVSTRPLMLLGVIAAQKEEFDVAIRAFQRVISIEPDGEIGQYARDALAAIDAARRAPPRTAP